MLFLLFFAILFTFIFALTKLVFNTFWPKPENRYYNGPKPTKSEEIAAHQFLIEHLQQFPDSTLKYDYPYLHDVATATRRYEELERLKEAGMIDEIDYERELEKILPLIKL
jgi:hypothetical protein